MCDRNDRVSGILQKISRLLAAVVVVQLDKYETAPYFFLLNQKLTWHCLLISGFLPEFD